MSGKKIHENWFPRKFLPLVQKDVKEVIRAVSISSARGYVLRHLHPPLLHPPPCNIIGACLCEHCVKFEWEDWEWCTMCLLSSILAKECFDTFFIRIMGLNGCYDVMVHKRLFWNCFWSVKFRSQGRHFIGLSTWIS